MQLLVALPIFFRRKAMLKKKEEEKNIDVIIPLKLDTDYKDGQGLSRL